MNLYPWFAAPKLGVAAVAAVAVTFGGAGTAFAVTRTPTSPSASVTNGTLVITGTARADQIAVADSADPNTLTVDLGGGVVVPIARTTFTSITVRLGDGNDQFTDSDPAPVTVDAGRGDDTVSTAGGNDVIFGRQGNDTIRSAAGDDIIDAGSGNDSVNGGQGHDTVFLGAGRDAMVWNPGDGSDTVDGGSGIDTLQFNGANATEHIALSANNGRAELARDVGNVNMDLSAIENVNVAAAGGVDAIVVNDLTGTDVRQANIDLSSTSGGGDGAADTVTVNGTDQADHVRVAPAGTGIDVRGLNPDIHITGAEAANPTDQLQVNTLGGNDQVRVAPNTEALIGVGVDLGQQ